MTAVSRYLLIALSMVAMAILFQQLYWLVMQQRESHTKFFYSIVENDFMCTNASNGKTWYTSSDGSALSQKEYFKALPFMYYRKLVTDGEMPDTLKGVEMDLHNINMTNVNLKLFPEDIDRPDYGLYPLYESDLGVSKPTLPEDFCRFTSYGIEFIDTESNRINPEKSSRFTQALQAQYFTFPPKLVAVNTSIRKVSDDGMFVVDANHHFYNLKMKDGQPEVTLIRLPRDLRIKHVECVEVRSKEFVAIVVSEDHRLFLLLSIDFFPQELPVKGYNPAYDLLRINGDMFQKTVVLNGPSYTRAIAMDEDYELLDSIGETWLPVEKTTKGRWARIIFPFQLALGKNAVGYKRIVFTGSSPWAWVLNLVLALLFIVLRGTKKTSAALRIKTNALSIVLVCIFGVYGFLACLALK